MHHITKFAVSAMALVVTSMAFAANQVVFVAAGSSAMQTSFETASKNAGINQGLTMTDVASWGTNCKLHDTSSAGIPDELGKSYVVYSSVAGSRKIWVYASVDSTVGTRAFFNSATFSLTDNDGGLIPADVVTSLQNVPVNVGMTDVTPYDNLEATNTALSLGYDLTHPVTDGATNVYPVLFDLGARPNFQVNKIGLAPILVFGRGLTGVTNVPSAVVRGIFSGKLRHQNVLQTGTSSFLANAKLVAYQREPLSGTYITFENCLVGAAGTLAGSSQENNVTANPLNETILPGYGGAGRVRSIGTGALVGKVNTTAGSIGYAFWSNGNFKVSAAGNTAYFTVDGVDPIKGTPGTTGAYPYGAAAFDNIYNGAYPIWSTLRAITDGTPSTDVSATINAAQQVGGGTDYADLNKMQYFRSHRDTAWTLANFVTPDNGIVSGIEAGADAGGQVFPKNADIDYSNDFGGSLLVGLHQ